MKYFIKNLLLVIIVSSSMSSLAAQYIRKDASTEAAKSDIGALEVALKKMKNMGCDEPFSWYYQGATHSIPDKINANPLCPSYKSKEDLKWAWDTCTHQDGSEIHFLIWHRLYIAHFEKIVRKLSGKSDFALPYWNYIDPNTRSLPKVFRNSSASLYEKARLPSLNNGDKIDSSMNDNLNINNLMKNRVFSVFNNNIDAAPHGAMHWYIGGGYEQKEMWNPIYQSDKKFGLMAHVPSAGFDPIFWLHHSNIDFLWQAWELSPNGKRPSLEELKAAPWPYQFYDENGSKIEYTIEEAYEAAFKIDYKYDQLQSEIEKFDSGTHKMLVADNISQQKQLIWTKNVGKSTKENKLLLQAPKIQNQKSMELMLLNRPQVMVIEILVGFKKQPADTYSVFILDENGNKSLAGVMTFFGAAHHMKGHGDHNHGGIKKFTYDVSSDLPTDEDYEVLIESQREKGEELTVKNISLYRY